MVLDSKLNFEGHIKGVFDKTSKSIGLIRKLRNFYRDRLFYKYINLSLDSLRLR